MPEIVARKGCSHSTLKFTDRRLMYKQLSITYDYFGILNCECLILFCLFHSFLNVFCRTLADIPSGNWGGCLSETILNDFFCVPEAIFKGFSLHPNTVIESDGRIPWTSRPAGRQFARHFKKMAKRSGRTGWKLQTDKIGSEGNYSSWEESIGLSWGETVHYLYLRDFSNLQIVPYKYFCRFPYYT